jgi:hypothetical protein
MMIAHETKNSKPETIITERPMLFSGAMVRGILDEIKDQTRRVVKLPKEKGLEFRWEGAWKDGGASSLFGSGEYLHVPFRSLVDGEDGWKRGTSLRHFCPYGKIGDRIWVKETFAPNGVGHHLARMVKAPEQPKVYYRATHEGHAAWNWKPSIFMPRWASRITLEITSIRVERLQEISEEDAVAEGCCVKLNGHDDDFARNCYRKLWETINGKGSWDLNPWVWVVGFRKVEGRRQNEELN